jgi:cytochrome c-type biogenesis protein CcmH
MNEGLLIGFLILLSIAFGFMLYPLRQSRKFCLLLVPAVILLVVMAYWHWGAWRELADYQQQQVQQQRLEALLKSMHGPQGIIKALRAKLAKTPNSARGWFLLGRLYVSQQQWSQACAAFKHAHRLQKDNDTITVHYAQSLWELNQQQFNPHVRFLLKTVLQHNSEQPDALAMLAMDAFQQKNYQLAIDYWQRLLKQVPPQSEQALAIRKAIAKAIKFKIPVL